MYVHSSRRYIIVIPRCAFIAIPAVGGEIMKTLRCIADSPPTELRKHACWYRSAHAAEKRDLTSHAYHGTSTFTLPRNSFKRILRINAK